MKIANFIILQILSIAFVPLLLSQNTMTTAVNVGTKNASFSYTDTINTQNYTNNYGRPTNDIFHKFTINQITDIEIIHCGSQIPLTYIYLLNASGFLINHANIGHYCSREASEAYLDVKRLPSGTYYVVSEGAEQNGNIITTIRGTVRNEVESLNLSQGQNYMVEIKPLDATAKADISATGVTLESGVRSLATVQYFDGLGRQVQTAQKISTNSGYLVSLQEYDESGRPTNSWLPAPIDNGKFIPDLKQKIIDSYSQDTKPYAVTQYEPSSLNRVAQEFGPGEDWHIKGKSVQYDYLANTASGTLSCGFFSVTSDGKLEKNGNYAAKQLFITRTIDEDGNISYVFNDKQGVQILIRQMEGNTPSDTYCVYDDFGQLRYTLPPKAADAFATDGTWDINGTSTQSVALKDYAYIYKYDEQRRCIEKKLPGIEPVFYVYDKAGRLILSQDGELRLKSEWVFNKYDMLGRLIISGVFPNTYPVAVLRSNYKNIVVTESYGNGHYGYTWNCDPLATKGQVLLVNYYDSYTQLYAQWSSPSVLNWETKAGYGTRYTDTSCTENSYKGLLTGTFVRNIDGGETITAMYYDENQRIVQTKTKNHLGGIDKEFIKYDFTGNPTDKMFIHGIGDITECFYYEYDQTGRLTNTWHTIDKQPRVLMSQISYDNLGRVSMKRLHDNKEAISYKYNIRSQLSFIRSSKFREDLFYNEIRSGNTPCYNGNIASVYWKVGPESYYREFKFTYNNSGWLKGASYYKNGSANSSYNTSYYYDKQGNMSYMSYNIPYNLATDSYLTQSLTIQNNGNQLKWVRYNGYPLYQYNSQSFVDGDNLDVEYLYDKNGNLVSDYNKGITKINYNFLNLPSVLQFKQGHTIQYTYDASGVKRKVKYTAVKEGINVNVSMGSLVPLTGGQISYITVDDYCGNVVYSGEGTSVNRILTPEGYLKQRYETSGDWVYIYSLKDHLGNVRLEFDQTGVVKGYTHYHPFGMEFMEPGTPSLKAERYSGKEFQSDFGLNTYDFQARMYDAVLCRFNQMDPLCEKYYSISPYVYCGNNPVNRIDPNGMEWKTAEDEEYARKLSNEMTTKINTEQKSIDKLNAKIAKNQERGKDVSKDQAKVANKQANIDNLNAGITELTEMGATPDQVFTYNDTAENVGGTDIDASGAIVMDIANNGSVSNGIHESSHGYDLWRNGRPTERTAIPGEIKAYSRQFSFDNSSLPVSKFGKANSLSDINHRWVLGINNAGDYLYIRFVYPNRNPKDILNLIK